MSETRKIALTRGLFATVDAADFDWLNQWKWCALKTRGGFYAYRVVQRDRKQTGFLMHRYILDAESGVKVDHIDRNPLNNARSNLRRCTQAQNCMNRPGNSTATKTSRFKGVYMPSNLTKWVARFSSQHIGVFESEVDAARAYDAYAAKLYPGFAFQNFPRQEA